MSAPAALPEQAASDPPYDVSAHLHAFQAWAHARSPRTTSCVRPVFLHFFYILARVPCPQPVQTHVRSPRTTSCVRPVLMHSYSFMGALPQPVPCAPAAARTCRPPTARPGTDGSWGRASCSGWHHDAESVRGVPGGQAPGYKAYEQDQG